MRLLQVVQSLLEVSQVVVGHAGAVQSFEVLALLQKHFQAVLLHTLVVDQLHLQQAGCRQRDQRGKVSHNDEVNSHLMRQEDRVYHVDVTVALTESSSSNTGGLKAANKYTVAEKQNM